MTRSGERADPLDLYLDEIRRWGARTNLVGSTNGAALARHVEDSLAAAEHLPSGAHIVDLGSGAGFPGIPLALRRPDLTIDLVEARERRVNFLRHVVRKLDLSHATVLRQRIEDPPQERYSYALLRGVAPPPESARIARPWVLPSGEMWIWVSSAQSRPPDLQPQQIPLVSGGSILRIHAAEVSRGTHD